jgi:methionyl-tRNA formyltransferase
MMKKYIILSEKKWDEDLIENLQKKNIESAWILINNKDEFTFENLKNLKPEIIFIPHWSYIIPSEIFNNFECIVFHMTDLPFGRGGSPLQNLIILGKEETKISALKVEVGLDTGPIYLKRSLSLLGTAQEIFIRSRIVVEEMIMKIVEDVIRPVPQKGKVVDFKRRKSADSNLKSLNDTFELFNHIRMLDCEGYPSAFIESDGFRFEFTRASLKSEKEIIADVRIIKK